MSETAATQLRRLLALIPRLADGGEHRFADIAEREGVPSEQVLRDVESIALRFGDQGDGFVEGVQIYLESDRVSLFTDHFLRPMRLTSAELAALELGLAVLRPERPDDQRPAIDRARTRLRAVIGQLPAGEVEHGHRFAALGAVGAERLAVLRGALMKRNPVRLAYRKASATDAEDRVVRPYALAAVRGAWYLVGYCERSEAVRIFRLDRTGAVTALDGEYTIPDSFSLEALLADGRAFAAPGTEPLRVRYSPRIARWIAERERGTAEPDGAFVVEHPLADAEWAVRHVLQYGPDAEVLAPVAVRDAVAARLTEILA